jgi:hypothetical protein
MIARHGFWQAQVQWYMTWTASPFPLIMVSVPAWLDFKGYFLLPLVTCALNLCALYALAHALAEDARKKFTVALTLQAAWLALVPGLNENFYWLCAMSYTWAATFLLFTGALLVRFLKKKSKSVKEGVACVAALFVTSAYMPQVTPLLCVLFFVLTLGYAAAKKQETAYCLAALCVSFAGFLAMSLAPGTAARMAAGGGGGRALQTLGVAAVFGGITALKFFTKPIIYLAILYAPDIAQRVFPGGCSTRLKARHVFALTALIAPFQQAVAGWALGEGLPPRAEGLTIWLMGAAWLSLWVFVYGNEAARDRLRVPRVWRGVFLLLCLTLSYNFTSLVCDLRVAPFYAKERRQRETTILRQKSEGKEDVVVPTLAHKPRLLYFSDIGLSPNDWKNQSFAEYWGVKTVSAAPLIGQKGSGLLSGMESLAATGDAEAQFMLGEIRDPVFAPLDGVPKDGATAARWYALAAGQGHAHAQRRLTRCYATGIGVQKNYLYAVGWLLRSQF